MIESAIFSTTNHAQSNLLYCVGESWCVAFWLS